MSEENAYKFTQAGKQLLGIVIALLEGVAIYIGKRLALAVLFVAVTVVVGPMMAAILMGGLKLLAILDIFNQATFIIVFTLMLVLPWLILAGVYATYERADFSS